MRDKGQKRKEEEVLEGSGPSFLAPRQITIELDVSSLVSTRLPSPRLLGLPRVQLLPTCGGLGPVPVPFSALYGSRMQVPCHVAHSISGTVGSYRDHKKNIEQISIFIFNFTTDINITC